MQEAKELANDPCTDYSAAPLETTKNSGNLHGESEQVRFLAQFPSPRHHSSNPNPIIAIIGLQGFFPLKGQAAVGVGSIEYPSTERKRLAALSREWYCPHCKQTTLELLPNPVIEPSNSDSATSGSLASPPTTTNAESPSDQPPPIVVLETNPDPSPSSDESPNIVHEVGLIPSSGSTGSAAAGPTTPSFITHASRASPVEDVTAPAPATTVRRSSQKSPLILDTAICVLLVLVFALVCRRIL
ncbi:non-canonical ubiquitin conjugating enzyme [Salix suchowensis]|nr:non-canonical ubiquitin conjugating enzyme [Salix suchowensis]